MLEKLKDILALFFQGKKKCGGCGQDKVRVQKRKFLLPPQMKEEMTSQSEMCTDCYHNLAKLVYSMKQ